MASPSIRKDVVNDVHERSVKIIKEQFLISVLRIVLCLDGGPENSDLMKMKNSYSDIQHLCDLAMTFVSPKNDLTVDVDGRIECAIEIFKLQEEFNENSENIKGNSNLTKMISTFWNSPFISSTKRMALTNSVSFLPQLNEFSAFLNSMRQNNTQHQFPLINAFKKFLELFDVFSRVAAIITIAIDEMIYEELKILREFISSLRINQTHGQTTLNRLGMW